jgi:hypothetical protein
MRTIKCRPSERDERSERDGSAILWRQCPAFNVNPRGILIHRIKSGMTHIHGSSHHDSVDYWCGNCTNGEGVMVASKPPADKLLCERCERLAIEAGEPTAEALAGRHVCVGVMKAFRLCCRNDQN